jgi:hypothetical protein
VHSGSADGEGAQFVHALTREVAYGAQLSEARQQRHLEVARALERLHADKLGPQAEIIAPHWAAAGRPSAASRWRGRASLGVSHIQVRRIDRLPQDRPQLAPRALI